MFSNLDFTFKIYTLADTEAIFVSQKEPDGSSLIVLVHGFNRFGAWELLWQAQRLVKLGYSVLIPSQPGFGGSLGKPDYCGPDTISRIGNILLDFEKNTNYVFPKKVIWGASRGALVAYSLLVQYPKMFDGGVLQAGIYDLRSDYEWKSKHPEIKANIEDETGATEESFQQRNPLQETSRIQSPLLLMHGLDDSNVSYEQTEILGQRLEKFGKKFEL